MRKFIELNVNAKNYTIPIDSGESLADTLRYQLGFTSVKKGCEVGECGACTVLIDGKSYDSCIYLTEWAQGHRILTVEGLRSAEGELHPVQKAFIEEAAIQCGFCSPGLILTAVELVGNGRKYTREEIRRHISGHLCRCTGYENIINAVERVVNETHDYLNQRMEDEENRSPSHVEQGMKGN